MHFKIDFPRQSNSLNLRRYLNFDLPLLYYSLNLQRYHFLYFNELNNHIKTLIIMAIIMAMAIQAIDAVIIQVQVITLAACYIGCEV